MTYLAGGPLHRQQLELYMGLTGHPPNVLEDRRVQLTLGQLASSQLGPLASVDRYPRGLGALGIYLRQS